MRELLAAHGLVDIPERSAAPSNVLPGLVDPRELLNFTADKRRSEGNSDAVFTFEFGKTGKGFLGRRPLRTAESLKRLANSALPSRAIRLIRDGTSMLDWGVRPKQNLPQSELERFQPSIDLVRAVLENPNPVDDDFFSFMSPVVEDVLVFDAGVWEYVERPDFIINNEILALYSIPGHTLAVNPRWDGNPNTIRWRQVVGKMPSFLDRDIEYIMQRKRTYSPFGFSPLETAVEVMEAWLALASYQRSVGSNAFPSIMLYLGDRVTTQQAAAMRMYWQMELEGRGSPGMWGNTGKPEVLKLKPVEDTGLYLRYQEMLVRTLAFTFGLKPQDFGMERDVNRSTSLVAQQQSIQEARRPLAMLIANKINCRILPRIAELTKDPLILQLKFFWAGIDPVNKKIDADIDNIYLKHDALKIDEVRARLDLPPLANNIGQLTPSAAKELFKVDPTVLLTENGEPMAEALLKLRERNGSEKDKSTVALSNVERKTGELAEAISQLKTAFDKSLEASEVTRNRSEKQVVDRLDRIHRSLESKTVEGLTEVVQSISKIKPPETHLHVPNRIKVEMPDKPKQVTRHVERDEKGLIRSVREEESE